MKARHLLYVLLFNSIVFAQNPGQFDIHTFNSKYLEHLVKTGVDEVRKSHNCNVLVNDSILFLASNHHANYMVRLRQLSHTEEDSVSTKTPQNRAEYFGSTNYRVGENILFTPYNKIVQGKDGNKFDTHTA